MQGRYEKFIVCGYLDNLIARTGRSSLLATQIAEWVSSDGQWLGIDYQERDDYSDKEERKRRRVRRRQTKVTAEAWREIKTIVRARKKYYQRGSPTLFDQNLNTISDYFQLDDVERKILDIVCRFQCRGPLEDLCQSMLNTKSIDAETLIARLLGLPQRAILRRVIPSSRLRRTGLLVSEKTSYLDEFKLSLPERLLTGLLPPNRTFDDITAALVSRSKKSKLTWEDFDHLAKERDFIANVLWGAMRQREKGINVLLYGPPGTGKSELCKVISEHVGCDLFAIGDEDNKETEPTRYERLCHSRLSEQMLAHRHDTVLVFDEMEDLLVGNSLPFFFSGQAQQSGNGLKAFINHLLEENRVPTFWTCNDLHSFDPAMLRRMTIAVEMKIPPPAVRERVWHRILDSHKIKLADEEIKLLARELEAAPALAESAVKATKLAGGDADTMRFAVGAIAKAVRGGQEAPPIKLETTAYHENLVNADMDLSNLSQRLINGHGPRNFSMCLYGPPGTGKSAYARHLAIGLGIEVIHKRASDLISMWVGETEQNIANAFAEARASDAFLVIDEADSFLQDRSGAQHSWEVTQVNEMLTWMEVHDHPFACTTNLMENLDKASLRRFTFKVPFTYLSAEQSREAFQHFFGLEAPVSVSELAVLTPGDFAVVADKARFLGNLDSPDALADMLVGECSVKPNVAKPIGFAVRRSN